MQNREGGVQRLRLPADGGGEPGSEGSGLDAHGRRLDARTGDVALGPQILTSGPSLGA